MKTKPVAAILLILCFSVFLPINVQGEAQSSTDWWPNFHHDLQHTGATTSVAPRTNQTKWFYTTTGKVDSSPAVSNGVVYFGSYDFNLYAMDASKGNFGWNYSTGAPIYSSPAVANGLVFVGNLEGELYAIDAITGALAWKYPTQNSIFSSPIVNNGVVYVGSLDHTVYALVATSGSFDWKFTANDGIVSSPAISGNLLYVGSLDGNVYALDSITGNLEWNFTIPNPSGGAQQAIEASPTVGDGKVFVSSEVLGTVGNETQYNGAVWALDALTGEKIWNYSTADRIYSSAAYSNGIVYIGLFDGNVVALRGSNGEVVWKYQTYGIVSSSPAVAEGVVYVGSNDGNIFALDAVTGGLIWFFQTGSVVESSPAVAEGIVYVGSRNWNIYAFSEATSHDGISSTTLYAIIIGVTVSVLIVLIGVYFVVKKRKLRRNQINRVRSR